MHRKLISGDASSDDPMLMLVAQGRVSMTEIHMICCPNNEKKSSNPCENK